MQGPSTGFTVRDVLSAPLTVAAPGTYTIAVDAVRNLTQLNGPGASFTTPFQFYDNFRITPIPEPTSAVLLLPGLMLIARRRR